MPNQKQVESILHKILDPEIGISILALGLIYKIKIDKVGKYVTIVMTLTSLGCPLFGEISQQIKKQVKAMPGVKEVNVELTFEPPWSMDRVNDEAKAKLGMI